MKVYWIFLIMVRRENNYLNKILKEIAIFLKICFIFFKHFSNPSVARVFIYILCNKQKEFINAVYSISRAVYNISRSLRHKKPYYSRVNDVF